MSNYTLKYMESFWTEKRRNKTVRFVVTGLVEETIHDVYTLGHNNSGYFLTKRFQGGTKYHYGSFDLIELFNNRLVKVKK